MIITYTPDGLLASDKRAYETMKALCEEGQDVSIGSDCLITALRLLIAEGVVDSKEIVLQFEDKTVPLDDEGQVLTWFKGFCDTEQQMLFRLLKLRMERKSQSNKGEEQNEKTTV